MKKVALLGIWLVATCGLVAFPAGDVNDASAIASQKSSDVRCPVTFANGLTFPGQGKDTFGYRSGSLWVELWPYGISFAGRTDVMKDGSLGIKFPWWREVKGRLEISGKRLDKPGETLKARVPIGYGSRGFQSSAIFFPSEGCWRVTGRVGRQKLVFVTIVLKAKTVREEVPRG
jgi:hypothetical protein